MDLNLQLCRYLQPSHSGRRHGCIGSIRSHHCGLRGAVGAICFWKEIVMTDQWTPNGDKWPQLAMVRVARINPLEGVSVCVGDEGKTRWLPHAALRPMPPTITPEQQAVLDAAVAQAKAFSAHNHDAYNAACCTTIDAARAMLAAQQPPDPVKELRKAWNANREHGWHDRMEAAIAALEGKS
jgi:hypothetical protein